MLNGIDPIIIFEFSKIVTEKKINISQVPVKASILSKLPLPYIPIYLSEALTGIYIDSEDKTIDIDTSIETTMVQDDSKADNVSINQRGINNTVKITMVASRDSVGLTLLSAMADFIFPKVTSREYAITYLHGAITVFSGLLHSFSIVQGTSNDLYTVTMELIKVGIIPKSPIPEIPNVPGVALKSGVTPA